MIIVGIAKFRTINNITIGAVIAVAGLWVNRYLIIVPTLETPYLPIQDTRIAWIHYSATWVEWTLSIASVAAFCLMVLLATKLVPIISVSEMAEAPVKEKETEIL